MRFFSPILFILFGLMSKSYAQIWPLGWHTAPLFAWFCGVNGACVVAHLSGLGEAGFAVGILWPVRAAKLRVWDMPGLRLRRVGLVLISIVRFLYLIIGNVRISGLKDGKRARDESAGWHLCPPTLPNRGEGWGTLVGGWERKSKGCAIRRVSEFMSYPPFPSTAPTGFSLLAPSPPGHS